ncbi:YueH family protein [Bacillus weihaiensis]|uniref:YueH-like protein n=1 Tax=Bacillus weihaiensis TaxID=1547283 RepID=A0A1L3MNH0_9BACI|nr:YueH family protein [Bacillus weihaiensis]APH03852.1 hypothetical protein A9C19_03235 [Bacillus weihaiensis]
MKIRKANVHNQDQLITNVYIYENKQQEFSMVAIPEIEWSVTIPYVEERVELELRLKSSLVQRIDPLAAEELSSKIVQWTGEM